jgi:hypothetical protein
VRSTGALGRALQRVDRAQVLRVHVQDPAVRGERLGWRFQRVFVQAANLEQVGDLGLVISRAVHGAFVQLGQLWEALGLRVKPCQRLERGRVARKHAERASVVLHRLIHALQLGFVDLGNPRVRRGTPGGIVRRLGLANVHTHELLPLLAARVELRQRLNGRYVAAFCR